MRREGFSLVEISVVLVVVATMLAGVLPAITESQKSNASSETADRMQEVKQALLTFRAANDRIPCPSDLTLGVNTANFGKEGDALGDCKDAVGTVDATFETAGNVVAGGVPTKTLGLPDEYAFDGWGRRLVYHVDKRLTLDTTYATTTTGSITVKDGASTPSDRTTTAAYALLSHGPNGHGAYTRANSRFSFGTTNTRELENCDCTNAAAAGTYNATLHQYMNTPNTDPKLTFDDILIYGSRASLDLLAGGGGGGGSTSAISTPWPDAIVCGLSGTTSDYVFMLKVDYQNNGSNGPVYEYDYGLTWNKIIAFTDAGAFSSTSGSGAALNSGAQYHPCQGKSISDLTTAGQAIFFKSTGGGGGSSFWADAGSNNINNNNSGNVGIGTAAPGYKLTVAASLANSNPLAVSCPSGGWCQQLLSTGTESVTIGASSLAPDGGAAGAGGYIGTNTNHPLYLRANSYSQMVLSPSGNVGIGTATPQAKLDVAGGVKVGTTAAACTAAIAGTLRYNAGAIELCNGTSWSPLGVASSGTVTGGCIFGMGWGTATNCGLSAGISCAAGNTARDSTYHDPGGVGQYNASGTYASGFCIKN